MAFNSTSKLLSEPFPIPSFCSSQGFQPLFPRPLSPNLFETSLSVPRTRLTLGPGLSFTFPPKPNSTTNTMPSISNVESKSIPTITTHQFKKKTNRNTGGGGSLSVSVRNPIEDRILLNSGYDQECTPFG